jgi:hypothetical protein
VLLMRNVLLLQFCSANKHAMISKRYLFTVKTIFVGKYRGRIPLSFLYIRQFVAKDTPFVRFFA